MATFVVQIMSWGGLDTPVDLWVEGLPAGWTSQTNSIPAATFSIYGGSNYGIKALLAITAPADAPLGTLAPLKLSKRATETVREPVPLGETAGA